MAGDKTSKSDAVIAKARNALAGGQTREALAIVERHMRGRAADADSLHLAGSCAWRAGNKSKALEYLRKCTKLQPRVYSYLNEYARMLVLSRDNAGVGVSAEALMLRPNDPAARRSHAMIVFNGPKPTDALPLLKEIAKANPADGEAHAVIAALFVYLGDSQEALDAAASAEAAGVDGPELSEVRGRALAQLKRYGEARAHFGDALQKQPSRLLSLRGYSHCSFWLRDVEGGQKAAAAHARLMPFERRGSADAELKVLVGSSPGKDRLFEQISAEQPYLRSNYISTLRLLEVQVIAFPTSYVSAKDVVEKCGDVDLIFNDNSNAEILLQDRDAGSIAADYAATGLPVLNPIAGCVTTSRDGNYQRFKDVSEFIFPRTERFLVGGDPALTAKAMLSSFDPPFMVRPTHTNVRGGLRVIHDAKAFIAEPALAKGMSYFAIEYYPSSYVAPDGQEGAQHFRVAVLDGEVIPDRICWSPGEFTTPSPDRVALKYHERGLFDLEERFTEAPEAVLKNDPAKIFAAIIEKTDLDLFGIDFGFDAQGRIVVYEINATMLFFPTGGRLSYTPRREILRERFDKKFLTYLRKCATRR